MAKDNNSFQKEERNLIDVFNELQELQRNPKARQAYQKESRKSKFSFHSKLDSNKTFQKTYDLKLSHIIIGCSALVIGMAIFFPKTSAFTESYAKEENIEAVSEYELNRHRLNMQTIISENSGMDRVKEQVTEERDVDFETTYQNNSTLPKGEEVTLQEGSLGKDNVTVTPDATNSSVTINDVRVDSKTKHAVSIKFNYGCISSDASKNGPKDIVDATGQWATSYDGYIASEKQFDAVWNSEYQTPNYNWRWAKYGEGNFKATTGEGDNKKPVNVPAAAVNWNKGTFSYNGKPCDLGELIRGVSSHTASKNSNLKTIISNSYYAPVAAHLISNGNNVADEYFTVIVNTNGSINLNPTSAQQPAVNVESTLHLEFKDGFEKTITIEIPIVVKP